MQSSVEQFNNLVNELEVSKSKDNSNTMGIIFCGEHFDSIPRNLLEDNLITPMDKYAWQRMYIEMQKNNGKFFPTYDVLQEIWGTMGTKLSRKTVRAILARLVLRGWMSCKMVRNPETGVVSGNVYLLHNNLLPLNQILTVSGDTFIKTLFQALTSATLGNTTNYLALSIMKDYINSRTNKSISSQSSYKNIEHYINLLDKKVDELNLSSNFELCKKQLDSKMELRKNKLDSKNELRKINKVPNRNLDIKSISYDNSFSTSTSNSNNINTSTCTSSKNKCDELTIPDSLISQLNEKNILDIQRAILKHEISYITANIVLQDIANTMEGRCIKNITGYIVATIKKAANGEYNFNTTTYGAFNGGENTNVEKLKVSEEKINVIFSNIRTMLKH